MLIKSCDRKIIEIILSTLVGVKTDLLHEICKKDKRILISIDDDLGWLSKFTQKYLGDGYELDNSGWHKFFFVPGKTAHNNDDPQRWIDFLDNFELLKIMDFDVAFIDQNPWLGRTETIKRLKHTSKYLIIHDFNYYPMNNIFGKVIRLAINGDPGVFDLSDTFKYYRVYFPNTTWPYLYGPGTLVTSETEPNFPDVDFNNY